MRSVFTVILLALGATGCVRVGDFDPVGNAASVRGSWTIDGATPTPASCSALGASIMQVTFLDDLRPVTHSGLRFECHAGGFSTDAEGGSGKVVAAPEDEGAPWRLRIEAAAANGNAVAVGATLTIFVPATEVIDIPNADFPTGTLLARFEIDGEAPNAVRCAELGVASVALVLDGRTDVSEACELGSVGARVSPGFSYTAQLRAFAPDGSVAGESAPETLTVVSGTAAVLGGGQPIDLSTL